MAPNSTNGAKDYKFIYPGFILPSMNWVLIAYYVPSSHRRVFTPGVFNTHFCSRHMFYRMLRSDARYISNHTMKHNSKQLWRKRARNFKSFQKLVYVKADNLAKILTNYILFSAQETRAAAWRKMYPGIVYTEQGQRAAIFQVDRKQEVYWRPFQRSWQDFSCEITKNLAKMRSDGNCHKSLGYLVEIIPWPASSPISEGG